MRRMAVNTVIQLSTCTITVLESITISGWINKSLIVSIESGLYFHLFQSLTGSVTFFLSQKVVFIGTASPIGKLNTHASLHSPSDVRSHTAA
jgi:hypothetical protein